MAVAASRPGGCGKRTLLSLRTSPQAGVAIRSSPRPVDMYSTCIRRGQGENGFPPCRICHSRAGLGRPGPPTARLRKSRPAFSFPPCGARKTLRAFAAPCVFRPLRKLRLASPATGSARPQFPRRRQAAIPRQWHRSLARNDKFVKFMRLPLPPLVIAKPVLTLPVAIRFPCQIEAQRIGFDLERKKEGTERVSFDDAAERHHSFSFFHLAVPEKPFGLTPFLRFFDRCGNSVPPSSAPGSGGPQFILHFSSFLFPFPSASPLPCANGIFRHFCPIYRKSSVNPSYF